MAIGDEALADDVLEALDFAEPEPLPLLPPTPTAVTLVDLHFQHCRFPLWNLRDEQPKWYCGIGRQGAGPYCPEHTRLAKSPRNGE